MIMNFCAIQAPLYWLYYSAKLYKSLIFQHAITCTLISRLLFWQHQSIIAQRCLMRQNIQLDALFGGGRMRNTLMGKFQHKKQIV